MYPIVPPPITDVGAFTVPRQLQKWLDVNPITKLTRTQAYITLPAFSVSSIWNGYSDIIASFNYEGPNNFSLEGFSVEPLPVPNYCLCIMWIDSSNVVHRYSIWRGVGEVFFFVVAPYTGQKIGKNFRFEIWSTNNTPLIQSSPINIYTSVLGEVDYRWGTDFVLKSADPINTAFSDIAQYNQPILITTNLQGQFLANTASVPSIPTSFWLSTNGGYYGFTSIAALTLSQLVPTIQYINNASNLRYTQNSVSLNDGVWLFAIINIQDYTVANGLFGFHDTIIGAPSPCCEQGSSSSQLTFNGNGLDGSPLILGEWFLLKLYYNLISSTTSGYLIPISGAMTVPAYTEYSIVGGATPNYIGLGANPTNFSVAELLIYDATGGHFPNEQSIVTYFQNKYNSAFSLPLTFPPTSVPQLNT